MAGFGIATADDFQFVTSKLDGAIIGSAFIKALKDATDVAGATKSFVKSIKG